MSHFRDLFHKPSGREHVPPVPPAAVVSETIVTSPDVTSEAPLPLIFQSRKLNFAPKTASFIMTIPAAQRPTDSACSA